MEKKKIINNNNGEGLFIKQDNFWVPLTQSNIKTVKKDNKEIIERVDEKIVTQDGRELLK